MDVKMLHESQYLHLLKNMATSKPGTNPEYLTEEFKFGRDAVKKIISKIEGALKTKDADTVNTLLKPVPTASIDKIKGMIKDKVVKDKAKFDDNFKRAQDTIKNVRNKNAKDALSVTAAALATVSNKEVEDVIHENERVFDPKNVLMLLAGLVIIIKAILVHSQGYIYASPISYVFLAAAILIVLKTTYNLIAGKEAKHLFIVI